MEQKWYCFYFITQLFIFKVISLLISQFTAKIPRYQNWSMMRFLKKINLFDALRKTTEISSQRGNVTRNEVYKILVLSTIFIIFLFFFRVCNDNDTTTQHSYDTLTVNLHFFKI